MPRRTLSTLLVLSCLACGEPPKQAAVEPPPSGVLLKGAGATFPALIFKKWFRVYREQHAAVAIAYDAVGSSEGIRRLTGKNLEEGASVDFAASDAAMTDEQIAAVPRGVLMLPVTAGTVVLAYNLPDLKGDLR